ncbi:MAG: hypothetical protein JSR33_01695 [Proteobacteria bacterium]|nr:hypothetical protein [Pseudomonadota bacterium]
MKRNIHKYPESLRKLTKEIREIQDNLELIEASLSKNQLAGSQKWQELTKQLQQVKGLIRRLKSVKSFNLLGKDYTNFCFLINYGNHMADYLLANANNSASSRQHAQYWRTLVDKFKPMIQEIDPPKKT